MATDLRNVTITQIVQSLKSRLSTAGQSGPLLFYGCREKGANLADVRGGRRLTANQLHNKNRSSTEWTCLYSTPNMFSETSSGPKDPFILQRLYTRKSWRLGQQLSRMLWLFRPGRFCLAGGGKVFIWRKVGPATEEVGPTIGKGWPAFSRANFFFLNHVHGSHVL